MKLRIPSFYIPASAEQHVKLASMTDEQITAHVHPWQLCPTCSYVMCSCGNCHNTEQCNEVCLHELSEH